MRGLQKSLPSDRGRDFHNSLVLKYYQKRPCNVRLGCFHNDITFAKVAKYKQIYYLCPIFDHGGQKRLTRECKTVLQGRAGRLKKN